MMSIKSLNDKQYISLIDEVVIRAAVKVNPYRKDIGKDDNFEESMDIFRAFVVLGSYQRNVDKYIELNEKEIRHF